MWSGPRSLLRDNTAIQKMWLVLGPQGPKPLWSQDQDYTLTPTITSTIPPPPGLRPGVRWKARNPKQGWKKGGTGEEEKRRRRESPSFKLPCVRRFDSVRHKDTIYICIQAHVGLKFGDSNNEPERKCTCRNRVLKMIRATFTSNEKKF